MSATPPGPERERGFTLLEVLIAVAILSLSLTSLLSSQMASMRATRYAEGVTAAAFLADYQLIEIQWVMKKEGWITEDKTFEGDFSELGWDDVRYECLVDFIELPEYGELIRAKDAAEDGTDAGLEPETYDAADQAFDAIGMVWPVVKAAIENAIRKASCTVFWHDGNIEHDFEVTTYWAEPERLMQIPELGGETTDEDDQSADEEPGAGPGGGPGRPGGGRRPGGAGRPGGGARPGTGLAPGGRGNRPKGGGGG